MCFGIALTACQLSSYLSTTRCQLRASTCTGDGARPASLHRDQVRCFAQRLALHKQALSLSQPAAGMCQGCGTAALYLHFRARREVRQAPSIWCI